MESLKLESIWTEYAKRHGDKIADDVKGGDLAEIYVYGLALASMTSDYLAAVDAALVKRVNEEDEPLKRLMRWRSTAGQHREYCELLQMTLRVLGLSQEELEELDKIAK